MVGGKGLELEVPFGVLCGRDEGITGSIESLAY